MRKKTMVSKDVPKKIKKISDDYGRITLIRIFAPEKAAGVAVSTAGGKVMTDGTVWKD